MQYRSVVAGVSVAAALLLSGCVIGDFESSDRFQTDFHYNYPMQPNGRVNVESFNGAIEIVGWDQNQIDISGTKYASTEDLRDDLKIDIRHNPDSIEIRTVKPAGRSGGAGARYKISVPKQAILDRISTSNGALRVKDVAMAAHLKTSNGSIRAENVQSDVEARTSNGPIEMDSVQGSAIMKTSNGRIRAEGIGGSCDAETSNSSITVRLETSPSSPIKLTTSNGSIDLRLAKSPKNDVRAETRNSSITVHLPAGTAARLKADTSNGSINSDFEMASEGGENRRHHLEGILGGGGPTVELSTSNGNIRIVKGSAD